MIKQRAFLGASAIDNLLPVLQEYAPRHVFLVRGKKSYNKSGAKSIIDSILQVLNCSVTEFYDFEENPKIEDLEKGLLLLRTSQPSVIVAIGGGSVLDMSKLLRFFYSYSGEMTGKNFKQECALLPLIALPTTAGTGCEATHFAVLYKDRVKYSVEHDSILPNVAIVYPPFTYNNSKYLTACTGFDALAQGIEAYWNVNATTESDEYAEKAIKLLWPNLPLAVNSPTNEIRDKVSEGAYWAGCAINITKTTAPHAFSYPFTAYYGYPHGHAVALTFPFFFNYCSKSNNDEVKTKIGSLCDMMKVYDGFSVYSYIKGYINALGLFEKKHDKFDIEVILRSVNLDRLSNYPVNLDNRFYKAFGDFWDFEFQSNI